ncbi:GNAT family N-acetyltransferase [Paenibacillus daejeonensis]|uniref:GNAT family N-acetyltransferase n=1 Tax=Paenibacillus daejeonensis TaxID=135193 RepID=UPI0003755C1F|nr:GNAT family N-acetyltransferase [Paenibacillus daejeonensis]
MTIIRRRNPRLDTQEILRLIRTELIPRSHTVREGDPQVLRELPKRLRKGETLVASRTRSGSVLGFVHFIASPDQLYIDMLAVHPQQQGRSLGKQLMQRAEAHGLSLGCKDARLFVDDDNYRARHFYTRLGYQQVRYLPTFRCYELYKRLAL